MVVPFILLAPVTLKTTTRERWPWVIRKRVRMNPAVYGKCNDRTMIIMCKFKTLSLNLRVRSQCL